jgi:hypothetical protein
MLAPVRRFRGEQRRNEYFGFHGIVGHHHCPLLRERYVDGHRVGVSPQRLANLYGDLR